MKPRFLAHEELPLSTEPLDVVASRQTLTDAEAFATDALAQQATSADTADLTILLRQEARQRGKDNLALFAWAGLFLFSMLWIATHLATNGPALLAELKICFCILFAVGTGLSVHMSRRSYRRKHVLTHALAKSHNVQQVGPLIRALRVDSTPARNLAKRALIKLLPTLRASDAPLLGDTERAILLRQLAISPNDTKHRDLTELFSCPAYRRETDLRVAILKALEQAGGPKELPTVERLARGLLFAPSAARVPDEVREAAKECLPYLQARANEQLASEQLLRASDAHVTPGDMLLRSANTQPDAAPAQLLRADSTNSSQPHFS